MPVTVTMVDRATAAPALASVPVPTFTASFSNRLPPDSTTLARVLVMVPWLVRLPPVRVPTVPLVPPVMLRVLAPALTMSPAMVPVLTKAPRLPVPAMYRAVGPVSRPVTLTVP
ncbi:hypothetical protein AZA_50475 [Nitrospirillum viridazoti Y2]|nr:hypothetical protein AZA_50475 [Nitrospirillum amazonense Y2]